MIGELGPGDLVIEGLRAAGDQLAATPEEIERRWEMLPEEEKVALARYAGRLILRGGVVDLDRLRGFTGEELTAFDRLLVAVGIGC